MVLAKNAAQHDAINVRDDEGVPPYLRDNTFGDKETKAQSLKYKYPHDYAGGWVDQQYLPDKLKDRIYYTPSDYGYERTVKENRKNKGKLK